MSQKSTVVSLPIINMNEAKYEDCVTIIRTYEKWIAEIYVKAGKLDKVPVVDNQPAPHGSAAPGQRDAHWQDTVNTPLHEMKIVFAGDQLIFILIFAQTWYCKSSWNPWSTFKRSTIERMSPLPKFPTPSKVVRSCFLASVEPIPSLLYWVFFSMSNIDVAPTIHQFPDNISRDSMSWKKEYFDNVFEKFVDQFLLQKVDVDSDDDDYEKNYALCFIFLDVFIMQLKEMVKGI